MQVYFLGEVMLKVGICDEDKGFALKLELDLLEYGKRENFMAYLLW